MTTTHSNAGPSWRARAADEVVWLALDEDHVLYHRPSGKTHFLNDASKRLLRDVLTVPKTAGEAAEAARPYSENEFARDRDRIDLEYRAGNGRLAVMKKLGWTHCDVVELERPPCSNGITP